MHTVQNNNGNNNTFKATSKMHDRKDYELAVGLDTCFKSKMETVFPWFATIDH